MRWSFLFAIILLYSFGSQTVLAKQIATPPDVSKLVEAWKNRQDGFKTAKILWTQENAFPERGLAIIEAVPGVNGGFRMFPGLDRETTFTSRHSLVFGADGRTRYWKHGRSWNANLGSVANWNYYAIHNPTQTIDYYSKPIPEDENVIADEQSPATGTGFLSEPKSIFADNIRYYYAAHMIFRPMELLDVSRISFANNSERVGDLECQIVICKNSEREKIYFYVDPKREFLPIKRVSKLDDKIWSTLSVDYEFSENRWLPTGWVLTAFEPTQGSIAEATESTVRSITVNQEVDESRFELEFPEGTNITDHTGDRPKVFKVQNDK